ncbi:MAG: PKD domain-containing protein [Thermodesulfobacteriota bacterium]
MDYDLPASLFPNPIANGNTYHVKVVLTGNRHDIYLDDIYLFTVHDGTFMSGRVGLCTYQTEARFDNLTVTEAATGPTVPHVFTAGVHDVELAVADAGGQTAAGIIPMTMQPGAPPVADASGPYNVGEDAAAGGGWTVNLDATGSTDDVEVREHRWDLGTDTFDGTDFNRHKWLTNGGISQNDAVSLVGVGTWHTRYLVSQGTFPKVRGQVFAASIRCDGGQAMFGFKSTNPTDFYYGQFPYAFYLSWGAIHIYEYGAHRADTGFRYSYNTWYDFRVELTDSGAIYSFRPTGGAADWIEVYRSGYAIGDTALRKGLVVYDYTWTMDNFADVTAGASAPFTLFNGVGTFPVDLTVVDRAGQIDTDSTTVTTAAADPPVPNAGPDQGKAEADGVGGSWAVDFDAGGSSDDYGVYFYEWDWDYDGVTFQPSGATGATASHTWGAPGTYRVAVRVWDNALQSRVDEMQVTISIGDPPVADTGGPYSVDETSGNALAGGWTVNLDGTGSTDNESSIYQYVWSLGTDTFTGTVLSEGKWVTGGNVSQNEAAILTGNNNWGQTWLVSTDTYPRGRDLVFQAKVRHSGGGHVMFGFKNTSDSFHYGQYPHAIYFDSTNIRIYEDGADRGHTGRYYSWDTWYEVRIELKEPAGARYFYRALGDADWILLYDSNYGGNSELRRGVDCYAGTFSLDDLAESAIGPSPSYRFYGLGSRPISLTVMDQGGQTHTDNSSVTTAANDPPVPAAGPDRALTEADAFENTWTVAFNGSGSTDDHGILRYEWDFDYDGSFEVMATGVTASHVYTGPGARTVALRVTDHALQSIIDTAELTMTVGAGPTAEAGPDATTEGHWPVQFNGAGSTDDVGIALYEWDFGDNSTGVGRTPKHSFWAPGDYTVTLTVYDAALQSSADTLTVHVLAAEEVPAANAGGPYDAAAGGPPAYFNAGASTDDFGIVKYLWDADDTVDADSDGNPANDIDVVGRKPFYTYPAAGTYTATLTVVDGAGQTDTATATVNVADDLPPDVICVPWRPADPTVPHEIMNGRAARLKAIVRDAGNLTYQWDFGDGSALWPATPQPVGNKYIVEASHTYPDSPDGTPYVATLTVWDGAGHPGSDQYYVIVRPNSLDTRTNIAIDEGLWWLHRAQDKGDGKWASYGSYYASPTASAVQAFEINAHLQEGDNQENPYVETVSRGLDYMFLRLASYDIGVQTYGDPDTNGNGIGLGVDSDRPIYEGGMVMDAIASSNNPLAFALTGGTNVKGRFFHHILVDMVDMYAWGQDEDSRTGGWRYWWNDWPDNSACQWAAIGMLAAEETFGINIPRWVKDRDNNWLNYSYDGTGFGYTGPGNGVALTPSGMVQLAFVDRYTTDPRWRTAEDYIANNWFWQAGNTYGMYALVKAFRLARPFPVTHLTATGLDWYNEPNVGVRRHLVDAQAGDGYWDYYGAGFGTAWSVIMLTPTLFVQPPEADAGNDIIWAYGLPLRFDASGSFHHDPNRRIVRYDWDFNGDGEWDFTTADPADPDAVFTYPDPDPETQGDPPMVFTARLRVTDDNEPPQTDIDTREVSVAEPPHAPFARHGGPYRATVGIPFTLDGRGSFDIDTGDRITRFFWDLDNDGRWFDDADEDGDWQDDVDLDTTGAQVPHTYDTPGVFNVGLVVRDNGVFNPVGCTPGVDCTPLDSQPVFTLVSVEANQPPVAAAGGPYQVDEGTALTLDGTGSSDPNNDPLTFAWDLDGDGQYDDATEASPSRTWTDDASVNIGLTVSDSLLADTGASTVTVRNVAPAVDAGADQTLNEGQDAHFNGQFTDPGADTHTIGWSFGDGGTASGDLHAAHGYPDDGVFTVTLTVTDDDGGVGSDALEVTVHNVAPAVSAGGDTTLQENGTLTRNGSFTDPGTDTHTATVDYGDGSGVQALALNPDKTFALSHLYPADGAFTVTVQVIDDDGGVGTASFQVTVVNVPPEVEIGLDETIDLGQAFQRQGSFTDPGASDTHTATVDYGDGTGVQALALNPDKTFFLDHVYTEVGVFTVTVTVTDNNSGTDSDTLTVTVQSHGLNVEAGAGATIPEHSAFTGAGSFVDPVPGRSHSAFVDYGDGTRVQELDINPDNTFSLNHVYEDNGVFTVTVAVVVDGEGGAFGSDTTTVTVENVAPVVDAGPAASTPEHTAFTRLGVFTDPSPADTFTATVDYGDGGGPETLPLAPGRFYQLDHVYEDDGVYTVTVTVTDDDQGAGTATVEVTVTNVAPAVDAGADANIGAGATFDRTGSFADPSPEDTFTATVDYGDGGGPEPLALTPDRHFFLQHLYPEPGSYLVTVTVQDDDGGVGTDTLTVAVRTAGHLGDLTGDRRVDGNDLVMLQASVDKCGGDAGFLAAADYNGDGCVRADDRLIWFGFSRLYQNTMAADFSGDELVQPVDGDLLAGCVDNRVGCLPKMDLNRDRRVDAQDLAIWNTLFLTVTEPAPALDCGGDGTAPENTLFQRLASFSDPDHPAGVQDTYQAMANYGEGGEPVALTLGPDKTFTLAYTYPDNGVRTVLVTLVDGNGGWDTCSFQVEVTNAPPVVSAGTDITWGQGFPFDRLGSFADPSASDTHEATVDYGDGSEPESLALNDNHTFLLHHVYDALGTYVVTVTVSDDDGGLGTGSFVVTVVPAAAICGDVDGDGDVDGNDQRALSASMNKCDGEAGFNADANLNCDQCVLADDLLVWQGCERAYRNRLAADVNRNGLVDEADRAVITDAIQGGYGRNPRDPRWVLTADLNQDRVIDQKDLQLWDAAFLLTANVAPVLAAGGDATIPENTDLVRPGSFTDPAVAGVRDVHEALVNFGDGTGLQKVSLSPNKTFTLQHRYRGNGLYTVVMTLVDGNGGWDCETFQVTVVNGVPVVTVGDDIFIGRRSAIHRVGWFADTSPQDAYTGWVDYGDGAGEEDLPLHTDRTFILHHRYQELGTYTVTVRVADDKGGEGTASLEVTVGLPGDLDHNGALEFEDLLIIYRALNRCQQGVEGQSGAGFVPEADYVRNGCIRMDDLMAWASHFRYEYYAQLSDVNGNGLVDPEVLAGAQWTPGPDHQAIRDAFGQSQGDPGFVAAADLDRNGTIGSADEELWGTYYTYFFGRNMCDLDGDWDVDQRDYGLIAGAVGSRTGQATFMPGADYDGNGRIDNVDVQYWSQYYTWQLNR